MVDLRTETQSYMYYIDFTVWQIPYYKIDARKRLSFTIRMLEDSMKSDWISFGVMIHM